jgi:hypothetical protein
MYTVSLTLNQLINHDKSNTKNHSALQRIFSLVVDALGMSSVFMSAALGWVTRLLLLAASEFASKGMIMAECKGKSYDKVGSRLSISLCRRPLFDEPTSSQAFSGHRRGRLTLNQDVLLSKCGRSHADSLVDLRTTAAVY